MVFSGNTSGSIKSASVSTGGTLVSYSLWNRTGGAIVVNIGIVISSTDRYIYSANLAAAGSTGSSYYQTVNISVPKDAEILISTSGSVDYYFTVE